MLRILPITKVDVKRQPTEKGTAGATPATQSLGVSILLLEGGKRKPGYLSEKRIGEARSRAKEEPCEYQTNKYRKF